MTEDKIELTCLQDSIKDRRVWQDMKSKLRFTSSNISILILDPILFESLPGTWLEMSQDTKWTSHRY